MTRDELIRIAVQCQLVTAGNRDGVYMDALEKFAELVVAATRNNTWTQEHWTEYERSIAAEERKFCANDVAAICGYGDSEDFAEIIRARGNT